MEFLHSVAGFYPTTRDEVLQLIFNLNNNKVYSYDKVTSIIIKAISKCVFDVLIYIYTDLSLSPGDFPSELKKAVVTPLLKKR